MMVFPTDPQEPLSTAATATLKKVPWYKTALGHTKTFVNSSPSLPSIFVGAVKGALVAALRKPSIAEVGMGAIEGTGLGLIELAKGDIPGAATKVVMAFGSKVTVGTATAAVPILGVAAAAVGVLIIGDELGQAADAYSIREMQNSATAQAHRQSDPRTERVSDLTKIALSNSELHDVLLNNAHGFTQNLSKVRPENHAWLAQSETNFLQTLARHLDDKGETGKATREAYASYLKDKGVDVNDPAALQKYTAELREMALDIKQNPASPVVAKTPEAAPVPPASPPNNAPTNDKVSSNTAPSATAAAPSNQQKTASAASPVTPASSMGGYSGHGGGAQQMRAESAAAGAPTAPQKVAASSSASAMTHPTHVAAANNTTPSLHAAAKLMQGMKLPAFA